MKILVIMQMIIQQRSRGGQGQAARGTGEEVPDVVGDPREGQGSAG